MTRTNLFLIFGLILMSMNSYSQELIINEWLKNNPPPPKKIKVLFQFDNRRSFVLDEPVQFSGLKLGVEFKEVHNFGLGFYGTVNPVEKSFEGLNASAVAEFNYTTIFYQYAFYHKNNWELSLPIHLGTGKAQLRLINSQTKEVLLDEKGRPQQINDLPFTVSELGIDGQYKFHDWFGLGAGFGYRFLVVGDTQARNLFDGVTYAFKVKFFVGAIINSLRDAYSYEQMYLRKQRGW